MLYTRGQRCITPAVVSGCAVHALKSSARQRPECRGLLCISCTTLQHTSWSKCKGVLCTRCCTPANVLRCVVHALKSAAVNKPGCQGVPCTRCKALQHTSWGIKVCCACVAALQHTSYGEKVCFARAIQCAAAHRLLHCAGIAKRCSTPGGVPVCGLLALDSGAAYSRNDNVGCTRVA